MKYEFIPYGKFGKVTFVEHYHEYNLLYGDGVYFCPETGTYQEMRHWRLEKFSTIEDCRVFCARNDISVVIENEVRSPLHNRLPNCRGVFAKRFVPYNV